MLIMLSITLFITAMAAHFTFQNKKEILTRVNAFHLCSKIFVTLIIILTLSYTLRSLSLNHNFTHTLPLLPQAYSIHIFITSLNLILGFSSFLLLFITFKDQVNRTTTCLAIIFVLGTINYIYLSNTTSPIFKKHTKDGFILQSDPMSCAAASFANIAKHYKINISEEQSAKAMGTTIQGTSPSQIVLGARSLGFDSNIFTKMKIENLKQSSILFVDAPLGREKHAIAFIEKRGNNFFVVDPDKGPLLWTENDLKRRWYGNGVLINRINP